MNTKIQQRLETLKAEFASGQAMLTELETKQTNLRQMLLRISGAIQVLEEILAETELPVEPEPAAAIDLPNHDLPSLSPIN